MDHYEELGLPRTASQEEIRQAYRRVACLLHPDRCKDDEGRRLADLQMKRLNGILEILTNPAARLSYDEQLMIGPALSLPPRPRHRIGLWVWSLSACVLLAALIFAATRRNEHGSVVREVSSLRPPEPVKSTPAVRRPAGLSHVRTAPRSVTQPVEELMVPPPPSDIATSALPELPVTLPPLAAPLPPPSSIAPPPERLTGEWLYVPSANAKHGELYPPEYIELRLTEEDGVLAGRYRARYQVSDRAISPDVAFHFRGHAEAGGKIPWTGAGGARGQLTLRRLDNGSLEVSWTADQLGTDLGLVSGIATLVRKQE